MKYLKITLSPLIPHKNKARSVLYQVNKQLIKIKIFLKSGKKSKMKKYNLKNWLL
jgi:hypothetical protein